MVLFMVFKSRRVLGCWLLGFRVIRGFGYVFMRLYVYEVMRLFMASRYIFGLVDLFFCGMVCC